MEILNSPLREYLYITYFLPKARNLQSVAKLFEHLKYFMSENSYLLQFYEINICQIINFGLYTVYNKREMIKTGNQIREKSQMLE